MIYAYDGRYLVRNRLRALLRPVCWLREHRLRLSPSEDCTYYCVVCHEWPLDIRDYVTPEQLADAQRRAAELARKFRWE